MADFNDHFSGLAERYASGRPRYPAALGEWLASVVESTDAPCWDCGTGSGQAAELLAGHFSTVIATDASTAQLSHAGACRGTAYAAMTAETSALADASVGLITVAQALHWFDMSRFYTEARRVLQPRGVLAVWTYGLISIDPVIDRQMMRFHNEEVGSWWPSGRKLVDSGYREVSLPFAPVTPPEIEMDAWWTLHELSSYLDTWSAVAKYARAHGGSPVGRFVTSIAPLWGPADTARRVRWPLVIKASRKG